MTRIILRGCNGKMGTVVTQMAEEDDAVDIVAGIDIGKGSERKYPVFYSFEQCNVDADVIIDFSSPVNVREMLDYAVKKGIGAVICTTGFSKEDQKLIEDASKSVPILRSANMSMGINLIMKLVKQAAQVLADSGFDIEIVEKHHNKKVDAPSGTALAIADSINEAMNNRYEYVYNRTDIRAPRVKNELGISAIRGGTIVGEHEIIFAGIDEVIEIKHTAYSKAIFAKGAIQAAKFIAGKPPGLYNMNDVIG